MSHGDAAAPPILSVADLVKRCGDFTAVDENGGAAAAAGAMVGARVLALWCAPEAHDAWSLHVGYAAVGSVPFESRAGSGAAGVDAEATEPLTSGQRRVLALMADGLTNGEIADGLGLTMGTVKNVVSEIYARLGVRDRVEAVLTVRGGRVGG